MEGADALPDGSSRLTTRRHVREAEEEAALPGLKRFHCSEGRSSAHQLMLPGQPEQYALYRRD
ncbi:MAG: hypothetical protein ACLVIR_13750 [Clostridium sp.]